MKLASERNLNKNIFPVMSLKGKEIQYPFDRRYKYNAMRCVEGKLGPKNLMIMDILATYLIHSYVKSIQGHQDGYVDYGVRIPTQNNMHIKDISHRYISHKILKYMLETLAYYKEDRIPSFLYSDNGLPEHVDKTWGRIKKPQRIRVRDSYLKGELSFLKGYSSKEINELIEGTGNCVLQMTYPVRYFDGRNYQNIPTLNSSIPSRFFRLLSVNITKCSKDGHALEREYDIMFDSILGYLFVQNCLSCYTDLIPDHFYSMSDYAQLFYRILILPYFAKAKNPITLNEIRYRLDFKTKDTYMVRRVVKRILDELEANQFIKEPKELHPYGKYLYSYIRNPWKDQIK